MRLGEVQKWGSAPPSSPWGWEGPEGASPEASGAKSSSERHGNLVDAPIPCHHHQLWSGPAQPGHQGSFKGKARRDVGPGPGQIHHLMGLGLKGVGVGPGRQEGLHPEAPPHEAFGHFFLRNQGHVQDGELCPPGGSPPKYSDKNKKRPSQHPP